MHPDSSRVCGSGDRVIYGSCAMLIELSDDEARELRTYLLVYSRGLFCQLIRSTDLDKTAKMVSMLLDKLNKTGE